MNALLPDFQLIRADSVADAVAARRQHAGSRFIAGGTDLVVNMRHGLTSPDLLIDLSTIHELTEIKVGSNALRIGAGVTIAVVAGNPLIAANYRAMAQAAEAVAGPGHRALATVGGNLCLDTRCIYYNQSEWWRRANGFCLKKDGEVCHVAPQGERCHAAFTGDLAPVLLALGAEVEVEGLESRRRMPLDQLYAEDGRAHLRLAADEL